MPSLHAGTEAAYSFNQAFRNGKAGANLSSVNRKMRGGVRGSEAGRPFPVVFQATVTFLPQE